MDQQPGTPHETVIDALREVVALQAEAMAEDKTARAATHSKVRRKRQALKHPLPHASICSARQPTKRVCRQKRIASPPNTQTSTHLSIHPSFSQPVSQPAHPQ
eukprot:122136-Chlamydomonas_euryale.AAC.1